MNGKTRILVVDDDPINVLVMEEILGEDHELLTASSGEEAFTKALSFKPDLILLDIMMPGQDGYEVCRRIRGNAELRNLKIILVSAKAMTSERLAGYDAGADDYLTKPFEKQELIAKIHVFLRLKSEEELSLLKSDLLNLVAYEIRSPLTAILPAAELLRSGALERDQIRELGDVIGQNARRLQALAERGLLLSEFRSPFGREMDREKVDITELFAAVCSEFDETVKEKHATVSMNSYDAIEVYGDRRCLKLAFSLLVENAVSFSKENAHIQVEVGQQDGNAHFAVSISSELDDVESMFDVFQAKRVDGQIVGSGVGLALAREIVLAHGGQLELSSNSESGAKIGGYVPTGWAVPTGV